MGGKRLHINIIEKLSADIEKNVSSSEVVYSVAAVL